MLPELPMIIFQLQGPWMRRKFIPRESQSSLPLMQTSLCTFCTPAYLCLTHRKVTERGKDLYIHTHNQGSWRMRTGRRGDVARGCRGKRKVPKKSRHPINPSCWQTTQEQGNSAQWWNQLHQRSYSPTDSGRGMWRTTDKMLSDEQVIPGSQGDRMELSTPGTPSCDTWKSSRYIHLFIHVQIYRLVINRCEAVLARFRLCFQVS